MSRSHQAPASFRYAIGLAHSDPLSARYSREKQLTDLGSRMRLRRATRDDRALPEPNLVTELDRTVGGHESCRRAVRCLPSRVASPARFWDFVAADRIFSDRPLCSFSAEWCP